MEMEVFQGNKSLVPVEPTSKMVSLASNMLPIGLPQEVKDEWVRGIWFAMLAASQQDSISICAGE